MGFLVLESNIRTDFCKDLSLSVFILNLFLVNFVFFLWRQSFKLICYALYRLIPHLATKWQYPTVAMGSREHEGRKG